jgi:DNA-binding Lrp family transcriptional regulator
MEGVVTNFEWRRTVADPVVPAKPCRNCGGSGLEPLSATDKETLAAMGHMLCRTSDLAELLNIKPTACLNRLESLRRRGLVERHRLSGNRGHEYQSTDWEGQASAITKAIRSESGDWLADDFAAKLRSTYCPDSVPVIVYGKRVTVEVEQAWATIGAITTAARWEAGIGSRPFDNFETRDEAGALLAPLAPIGSWLTGKTLHVHLLAGIGA